MNVYEFHFICFYRTNVVMNYTEIEGKVREATNDEAWGPTGPIMQELAHSTFTYEHFPEVMSMLWKRMLQDNKTNWRRTYKVRVTADNLTKQEQQQHIYANFFCFIPLFCVEFNLIRFGFSPI